ncbi:MAG TPA: hypothetical protein VHX86_01800 [Tepidisphaeraceae bacterium]|jgi:hypothetical protein|nr:hypothetical protein [Tepidisphaeraceae bacterium]
MKLHEKPARASASCCANGKPNSRGASDPQNQREGGEDRRLSVIDRRGGLERRHKTRAESDYTGPERRAAERRETTGLERRRGPGRRLSDDRRCAEEGEMTAEQFEFVMAIETYKKVNKRMYPTWTEVLEVVQQLGYRKVSPRSVDLANVPEPALSKAG